ncbi:WD40 repeat-like protein [Acephala macrosclerotiorum]|nr:WD40 repeat-like protein [Acephala macrosclerotiorum]
MESSDSAVSMSLQHEHILNPVTALEFYQQPDGPLLILAGEGNFLKIFEAETSKLLSQCEVFEHQIIHGVVATEPTSEGDVQVLVWGGSCLTKLEKFDFERLLAQDVSSLTENASEGPDWILDAVVSPIDPSCCVLITAHNTLLRAMSNKTTSNPQVTFETVASPARSILYSAHLVVESSGEVLVASGTVFGEIIVWSCSASGASQVLFTFTGHEGSIFGINISPLLTFPDQSQIRLLASCSDDRTIRVWDLTTVQPTSTLGDAIAFVRETGFGQNDDNQNQSESRCIGTVMAHASRIWHVNFLVGQANSDHFPLGNILSFGEDSTTQQWKLDLGSNLPSKLGHSVVKPSRLTHLTTYAFHSGKHIWSTALHYDASKPMFATGGADGKISLLELAFPSSDPFTLPAVSDGTRSTHSGNSGSGASDANFPVNKSTFNSMPGAGGILTSASSVVAGNGSANVPVSPVSNGSTQPSSWDLEEDILAHLPPSQVTSEPTIFTLPETELVDGKPPKKKTKKIIRDVFNKYTFVSESLLLFTTTFGRVIIGKIGETPDWKEVILPESAPLDLKSYSVVHAIPELGVAYLAGANGNIYAFSGDLQLLKVGTVDGKVADMFKIFNPITNSFELLVTTLAGKVATLFSIGAASNVPNPVGHFQERKEYCLPERVIVTSAGRLGDLLILGSRSGSLLVFDAKRLDALPVEKRAPSLAGDAITTIMSLPTVSQSPDKKFDTDSSKIPVRGLKPNVPRTQGQCKTSYLLTTGRNGVYAIFTTKHELTPSSNVLSVVVDCVHVGSLPFGPMVEAAWFDSGSSDLVLYGFKSKNFIVWNETKQLEIANVDCGGAHRSYAYSSLQGGSGGHFAYTKASRLYIHSQRQPSHAIVKQGGHGREIKACAVSTDGEFIVTGAEDTTIRIWSYDDKGPPLEKQFRCQAILQKRTAGVQYLHWHRTSSGANYLFSSGGNEEFFIWSVEHIPGGIGVVCEATCPDQSQDCDLRIMSLDVTDIDGSMLISLAYSDSTIRTYKYSKDGGFKSVVNGKYTSSCLTQIRHLELVSDEEAGFHARLGHQKFSNCAVNPTLQLDSRNDGQKMTSTQYLITSATDGNVSLWSISLVPAQQGQSEPTLLGTQKIHQSSIKSLDFIKYNNSFLVVTGGDDNALGILIYSILDGVIYPVPKRYISCSAHAAAVTGLCVLPLRSAHPLPDIVKAISSGNDQRVKEWHIKLSIDCENEAEVIGIENLGDRFTSVADVGDMAVLRNGNEGAEQKILIVGNGMEVWKVPARVGPSGMKP